MTRSRRGYIARRRRTKICLFASSFRGAHSRLTRTITQQKIRALVSAHPSPPKGDFSGDSRGSRKDQVHWVKF